MKNDPIRTKVLSIRLIPNADRFLLKAMQVQEGHRSLGLITTDCDDVSYAALDEATKKADVSVAYARSMYGRRFPFLLGTFGAHQVYAVVIDEVRVVGVTVEKRAGGSRQLHRK